MKKKNDNREMQIIFMENFSSSSLKIHGWMDINFHDSTIV